MKFEITSRWSGAVLFSLETESMKLAVEAAVNSGARLYGAHLRGAHLTPIRDDIWAVLASAPAEVAGLRTALAEGRIDGSTYEGACCCLVGTLTNERHYKYAEIPSLVPDGSRPAERFFAAIKAGDTPETSQFSKLALEWVELWLANMRAAFAAKA